MAKYRILRVIEYEGDLAWIHEQLKRSIHGEKIIPPNTRGGSWPEMMGKHEGGTIRAATLGVVPELLADDKEPPSA